MLTISTVALLVCAYFIGILNPIKTPLGILLSGIAGALLGYFWIFPTLFGPSYFPWFN